MGGGCLLDSAVDPDLDRAGAARVSVVSGDGDRVGARRATSALRVRSGKGAGDGGDARGGILKAGVVRVDWPRWGRGVRRTEVGSHRSVPHRCPCLWWWGCGGHSVGRRSCQWQRMPEGYSTSAGALRQRRGETPTVEAVGWCSVNRFRLPWADDAVGTLPPVARYTSDSVLWDMTHHDPNSVPSSSHPLGAKGVGE